MLDHSGWHTDPRPCFYTPPVSPPVEGALALSVNSTRETGAASPRRGPIFSTRVYPPARPLKARSNFVKQTLYQFSATKIREGKTSRMDRILFAKSYQTVRPAAKFFGLRISRSDLFPQHQCFQQVPQQRLSVRRRPIQFSPCFQMSHRPRFPVALGLWLGQIPLAGDAQSVQLLPRGKCFQMHSKF